MTDATAGAPDPPKKARGGPPKSTSLTLSDPAGNVMRITATIKNDGTAKSFVTHRELGPDGKTKAVTRGATQDHANLDEARASIEKIKNRAVEAGWLAKVTRVGAAKVDAFDAKHLPAPAKAKK